MAGDWRRGLLAEVVEGIDYGLSAALSAEASDVPVLRMGNLKNGRVDLTDLKFVPIEKVAQRDLLADGDVLLNRTNSADLVGKVGIFRAAKARPTTFASYLFRLRARPSIAHPEWLLQVLASASYQQKLRDIATRGVSQSNINRERLRELPVQIPPLPEQRKIAAILSSVDETIEKTAAVIERLDVVKKAMLEELLTRGMPGRHSRFKETEIGVVPEGWEVLTLDECIDQDRPICYGILMPGQNSDDGVPVIKVRNIVGGMVATENLLRTSREIDAQYKRSRLRAGDLLLSIRGTTGRVALTPEILDGANITQDTARVSAGQAASGEFLFFSLQSPRIQAWIQEHTRGQAVKGINIRDVRRIPIPIPSLTEQQDIARLLRAIDSSCQANSIARDRLASIKAGLSAALLSGEVRVSP